MKHYNAGKQESLLPIALDYYDRGLCVIPVIPNDKKPPHGVRWKPCQTSRPCRTSVRNWFKNPTNRIGVVMGSVSRGIGCRDFDTKESLEDWLSSHRVLASELPIARSHKGGQVYFRRTEEHVSEVKARLGRLSSKSGHGAINVNMDGIHLGEMRFDVGAFCVLPPSPHQRGGFYEWQNPLPTKLETIPELDVVSTQLLPEYCFAKRHRGTEDTRDLGLSGCKGVDPWELVSLLGALGVGDSVTAESVDEAILRTLPPDRGFRNNLIFEFVRELKAFPSLAMLSADQLEPVFEHYYERARPVMQIAPEMIYDDAYQRFANGWEKCRHAKGCEEIREIWATAMQSDPPQCVDLFRDRQTQWLVMLCCELQRRSKKGSFYLDCRTAGELIGKHHDAANNLLKLMVRRKVLTVVKEHNRLKGLATEYRYLGDFPELGDAWEAKTSYG